MKGLDVKSKLKKSGYVIKEVAALMGETPQNINSMLNAEDIKTGVLERIAKAINKNLYFFFDDNSLSSFEATLIKAGKPAFISNLERVGRTASEADASASNEERLWAMIESQQRMLESQQRTIEEFAKKRIAEAAPGVAPKAARG